MRSSPSARSMVLGVSVAIFAALVLIAVVFLVSTARNKAASAVGAAAAHPQAIPGPPRKTA